MQKILGNLRRAVQDFSMIEPNDRIAVGVSGGKDSISLLAALAQYKRFSPAPFELVGININMCFADLSAEEVKNTKTFCDEIGVPFYVEDTDIAKIIFEDRKEKNPCSLCSKMRRGALNSAANKYGFNKVALGHHADDLLETFFLSLLYEGRISTFKPKSFLDQSGITLIRPFIYVNEKDIVGLVRRNNFPVIHNPCPADKHTKRQDMKELIAELNTRFPASKDLMLSALFHPERNNLWDKE